MKPRSSVYRITRAYAILLTIIMLIVALAISVVVGLRVVKMRAESGQQQVMSLQQAMTKQGPDWDLWQAVSMVNTRQTHAQVKVTEQKQSQTYTMGRTQRWLKLARHDVPLLPHVIISADGNVYYAVKLVEQRPNRTVTYRVWVSMAVAMNVLGAIISIVLAITILGLVVGGAAIYAVARRLNRPLGDLADAAAAIEAVPENTYHETLPVPAQPLEVQELSQKFNRLLSSLNQEVLSNRQFVGDVAHELRTPLAAIRGHLALIRRHGQARPELVSDSLATIEAESQRMQELIDQFLSLARMPHQQLTQTPVVAAELVTALVAQNQKAGHNQVQVAAPLTEAQAIIDASSIRQALQVLIDNALKYGPATAPVLVSATATAATVTFAVSDAGPGVPEEARTRIFDRFYRLPTDKTNRTAGSGLGLAIVAQLVALNHGQVQVVANHPVGSRFEISVSRARTE